MWKIHILPLAILLCLAGCYQNSTSTVSGIVELEGQTNHEGIHVYLPGTQYRAVTNDAGEFTINGIPHGSYTVVAEHNNYDAHREDIELKRGENHLTSPVTLLEIIPDSGTITGFISIPGQSIHEGVLVMVVDHPISTKTNTTGFFELEQVPPGTHTIMAYLEGWLPFTQEGIRVTANNVTKVPALTLVSPLSQQIQPEISAPVVLGTNRIRGYAFLQGSLVHEGISVSLKEEPSIRTITDATGMYIINGVDSAAHTLVFEREGYVSFEYENVVPVDQTSNRVAGFITLRRASDYDGQGILQGTVLLEGQENHANTIVRLEPHNQPVVTGSDGKYLFVGVDAGTYILTAEHPGYKTEVIAEVMVLSDQINDAQEITLQSEMEEEKGQGGLRGIAMLDGEIDHAGILVALEGTGYTIVTGVDGRYNFETVPAGYYNVIFSKSNYKDAIWEAAPVVNNAVNELERVVLKPDVDPPRVVDSFPAPNARAVPIAGWVDVLIRFSERMNGASVKHAVQIDPPVSFDAFFDRESDLSDLDVLHLRLYQDAPEPIRFKTVYSIMITPIAQTPKGVGLEEPFLFSFQTDGPLILHSVPEQGNTDFMSNLTDPIYIETNAPVSQADIERSLRFRPRPESEPMITVNPVGLGSQILIYVSFKPDTQYRMMFDQNLKTIDGMRFSNAPYSISFSTRGNSTLRTRRAGLNR